MKHAYELELLTTANRLSSVFRLAATTALAATVLASAACAHPHADQDQGNCGTVLAQRPVVLLGESHDNAEHHRWQLHTLAALHGHNPDMILGFESFPRRVQPVLDQWVNGELDPIAFLEAADWAKVWSFDPTLYLPLFDFARQNRIPMIALNVDRDFVVRVRREGWSAIPADERLGLSDPASAALAYRESLAEVYAFEQLHTAKHVEQGDPHQAGTEGETTVDDADAAAGEGESPADETDTPTDEGGGTAGEVHAPTDEANAAETESDAPADETDASATEADAPAVEVDVESILESEDFAQFVSAQQTWDRGPGTGRWPKPSPRRARDSRVHWSSGSWVAATSSTGTAYLTNWPIWGFRTPLSCCRSNAKQPATGCP